jgi:ABC-type branched-subunit amino acid transport system substrate-binding protein
VVVASVLVAAGCGRSGGSTSTGTSATGGQTAGQAAARSASFGTLKSVCGPGNATGATDAGVTNTSINVATMADPGATVDPGLDQELFDAADAFVGWCNAAGGILGRKLVLHKRDSALTQVAAQMIQACQAPDFAIVGNGEALDATGVQQRLSCKLPELPAYDVSAQAATASLTVPPVPNPADIAILGGAYRALAKYDPAAIKHYGMLSQSVQSIKDAGNKDRASAEAQGYVTVDYEELPLQVDNWRPIVENLKSKGVQVLTIENSPDNLAALYRTMADVGWFPKYFVGSPSYYDTKLTSEAGSALQGVDVLLSTYNPPFELADQYPAVKQYIDNLNTYANGAKPKQLGENATSAWLLFAEAAKACGSNLTRTCVVQQAQNMHNWTGGGINAPTQPGNSATGVPPECFVLIKATPTGFVVDKDITKPNNGIYNCDPGNLIKLKGLAGT